MPKQPDQRDRPETVELAAELSEAIDRGDDQAVEELGRRLHEVDPNAGAASSD